MTIIGKSKAAIAMILDALPLGVFEIKIYNNLDIPGTIIADKVIVRETKILNDFHYWLGGVMPETKRKLVELFNLPYQKLINSSAIISAQATIGEGTIIDGLVFISSRAQLGKYVTVYSASTIAHDSVLGDYVTICPNVAVCGEVTIGEGTFVGAGSVIKNGVQIGKNCVVGAGSVVLHDVQDGKTIYGNPAKENNV